MSVEFVLLRQIGPMQINVADITDNIRSKDISPGFKSMLTSAAQHFKTTEDILKKSLSLAVDTEHLISARPLEMVLSFSHDLSSQIPHWNKNFPKAADFKPHKADNPDYIYFPACVTRIFGSKDNKLNMMDIILNIAEKANLSMTLPDDAQGLCCSQIWQHKGDMDGARIMANKIVEHFWTWSDKGKIPIVCDTTSCTHTLLKKLVSNNDERILSDENISNYQQLKILDITEWLSDCVMSRLTIIHKKERVLLHPTCACEELGLTPKMQQIAQACAKEVVIPKFWACCGASGDRSFLFPELGESVTREEREELKNQKFDGEYSLARTCEINMESNMKLPFESIVYLVWDAIS